MQRLRPLSERECYLRCYGQRSGDVRVVEGDGRAERSRPGSPAERVRRAFEAAADGREAEAA